MQNKRTILVVGCGYLGERVVQKAISKGWNVYATTRNKTEKISGLGAIPVICDVTNPETVKNLPMVDGVVHCVGMDRASGKSMEDVYVNGLCNVATHFADRGFSGDFVHVSSTSVYPQDDGGWVTEVSLTNPVEGSGPIILAAEKVLQEKYPLAKILRFAGIYGPNRLIRSKAILSGEPIICDHTRWLNLVHVEDGASVVLAALKYSGDCKIFNVSDDEPVVRKDFYDCLAKLLKANPPHYQMPDPKSPASAHEGSNRRISNRLMKSELLDRLEYPNYIGGLRDCVNRGAFA